jgi:hypothetical protein
VEGGDKGKECSVTYDDVVKSGRDPIIYAKGCQIDMDCFFKLLKEECPEVFEQCHEIYFFPEWAAQLPHGTPLKEQGFFLRPPQEREDVPELMKVFKETDWFGYAIWKSDVDIEEGEEEKEEDHFHYYWSTSDDLPF